MVRDYVETNVGRIPVEDYKEIVALQYGFDSYEELLCAGYEVDINNGRCSNAE